MLNNKKLRGLFAGILAAVCTFAGGWPVIANVVEPEPASPEAAAPSSQANGIGDLSFVEDDQLHLIPAAAFSSDGFDPDSFFFTFGGGYMRGNAAVDGCVKAPVYLPEPARVSSMYASVYDNDGIYDVTVTLRRVYNYSGSTTDVMASVSTSGSSSSIESLQDATIDNPVIVYPFYSYYVTTCLNSSNIRLYSVRIYYDVNKVFLPLIIKN